MSFSNRSLDPKIKGIVLGGPSEAEEEVQNTFISH